MLSFLFDTRFHSYILFATYSCSVQFSHFIRWLSLTFISFSFVSRRFVILWMREWEEVGQENRTFFHFCNHKRVSRTIVINYFIRHLEAFIMMICIRCSSRSFFPFFVCLPFVSLPFNTDCWHFHRQNYTFYAYKIWLNPYTKIFRLW